MRVLVAASEWFPDWRGGNARVVAETAARMARAGHTVTVIAPATGGAPEIETVGDLTVRRVIRRSSFPSTVTDFVQSAREGFRLRRERYDLVVAHSTMAACGLALARVAPTVLVFHAPGPREMRFERQQLPFGARRAAEAAIAPLIKAFEIAATRIAFRVLVLSEFSRSVLVEDYPRTASRIRRVSGGVDAATFSPGDGPDAARSRLGVAAGEPLLFTVRRLEPRMGLENLVAAVAELRTRLPVRLVIAGGGSLAHALARQAHELGVGDRVRLIGRISDADLADWYRAADLFVLPTAAYEGFGLVTAEALASGTPVVGTPVGATPELLQPLDPRLVARSATPSDIADAIADAVTLTGPELRTRCRRYAEERYSWDAVMPGWIDALQEAIADSRGRGTAAAPGEASAGG